MKMIRIVSIIGVSWKIFENIVYVDETNKLMHLVKSSKSLLKSNVLMLISPQNSIFVDNGMT